MRASDSVSVLGKVAEKAAPGRPPAYNVVHVLKALELIGSGAGVGRQRVAKALGLGEGTARTLVRHMRGEGLVAGSRGGLTLTPKGYEVLSGIASSMISTALQETAITVGPENHAVLVRGSSGHISRGVEQRDTALLAGAKGATTLLYDGARFHAPGLEIDIRSELASLLVERLGPRAGDVVVVGTADDQALAEVGAKAAALELLRAG